MYSPNSLWKFTSQLRKTRLICSTRRAVDRYLSLGVASGKCEHFTFWELQTNAHEFIRSIRTSLLRRGFERERVRKEGARGIMGRWKRALPSTFPEVLACSPFSSPVLQYIQFSRLLSTPLKTPGNLCSGVSIRTKYYDHCQNVCASISCDKARPKPCELCFIRSISP